MRGLFLAVFALFPVIAFSQSAGFTLKGNIKTLNEPASAFLIYKSGDVNITDSAKIKNGIFEFKGQVANPVKALIVIDHKGIGLRDLKKQRTADLLTLYIEAGSLNITGTDSIAKAEITGSKINDDNIVYQKLLKPVNNKLLALNKEFVSATSQQKESVEFKRGFQQRAAIFESERKVISKNFILKNPDSYVSLEALKSYGGYAPDIEKVEPLFSGLSSAVKESAMGKEYATLFEKARATAIGAIAPEFTQDDPDGKPVKISDFRGRYVLVDFWASWCGPCRRENPNVVENYNKYKDKNFTVLGVSLDRPGDKDKWIKAIEDDNLTWTNISDLNYFKNTVAVQYNITSIPQNYLIDPSGKIIAKNLRGEELGRKLKEVFKRE